ncbi:hypothetical protein OHB01_15160 [Microbispora hainanensis]|uniref:Adenylate/guanylate cyclase domain-containing protein n=1 Tax=Microbispora hainanensis TaxID=568844 RepID=A0ABZ1SHA6_9ACTN|nr:hypothetical protein [Microbispora hainanensis]
MTGTIPAAIRRLCLRLDTEAYSARDVHAQIVVQSRLSALTAASCRWAGVDASRCELQPSGDGVLVIFPADIDEGRAIPRLLQGLADGLRRGNALDWPGDRMRLRAALSQGTVRVAENGYVGRAVVAVSRLVDAPPLRVALAARPDRDLAVIVTDDLYQDMRHDVPARAEPYERVRVSIPGKGFEADAWISVPQPGSLLQQSRGTPGGEAVDPFDIAIPLGLGGGALGMAAVLASQSGSGPSTDDFDGHAPSAHDPIAHDPPADDANTHDSGDHAGGDHGNLD